MDERICFPYRDDEKNTPEIFGNIEQIYHKMMDESSKEIFVRRLLISLTGNYTYMRSVVTNTLGGNKLLQVLNKNDSPQYIYGAGIRGKRLAELFMYNNWGGFIDINKKSESYHGIPIVDLDQFINIYTKGTIIIVSNMQGAENIRENLLEKGIFSEDVYVLNDFDIEGAKDMYFPTDCIRTAVNKEKAFVDIGCYDGKDSLGYMKWIGDSRAKIYAFEPDAANYKVCQQKLDSYHNIELYNVGLSDTEQEISVMGEGEMSYLGEGGSEKVKTKILDNILQNDAVGYIKMDVEGYEVNVLKGSEKIIRSQHPVLAISLYHKKSDIWRIPKLLLEFNSHYYFYMRYYGAANGDTVLYAVDYKE